MSHLHPEPGSGGTPNPLLQGAVDSSLPSVIVLVVHICCIVSVKVKYHSPIAGDLHRPFALARPFDRMQTPSGNIHVPRRLSSIERSKNQAKSGHVVSVQSPNVATLVEPSQPPMPDPFDHVCECNA